jgi:hypothetical protein
MKDSYRFKYLFKSIRVRKISYFKVQGQNLNVKRTASLSYNLRKLIEHTPTDEQEKTHFSHSNRLGAD